jgi:type I site-specific restriction endonuclease
MAFTTINSIRPATSTRRFRQTEAKNTTIAGRDIGRKIFSEDTDKLILENLINNGIKDETGSLIGKTIIFAQRQDHAPTFRENVLSVVILNTAPKSAK